MRFSIAAVVSIAIAFKLGHLKNLNFKTDRQVIWSALIAVMSGGVFGFLCYTAGISKVPASYAALLTSLAPLFVLPMLVVYNRKWPPLLAWLGALLGIGGIFLCLYK